MAAACRSPAVALAFEVCNSKGTIALKLGATLKEIFDRIFRENTWGNADSRSGDGGSTSQTTTIRAVLPEILQNTQAKSILDLPCGDFHWMQTVYLDAQYIGADIVPELIDQNKAKFGSDTRQFILHDITQRRPPAVDLILCRDLLVHFSFQDLRKAYDNIRSSGSQYLLTTTFPTRRENVDIKTGEWRPLNLSLKPFNFPAAIRVINENCTEWDGYWADKSLGLWRITDLPEKLS